MSSQSSFDISPSWEHLSNQRRKPPKRISQHRVGPAPREAVVNAADESPDIGTLDSDVDDFHKIKNDDSESKPSGMSVGLTTSDSDLRSVAGSKALIIYLAKTAKARGPTKENIDFHFLETILRGRADINATDKHGQTPLHEVVRNWHPDVALFFLQRGADVNKCDKWGRAPIHLAAAVNYHEMVEFLILSGANIHAKTKGEEQSPIHYAAKYNAVNSLKVLIDRKARVNDRDYKRRTPLHIAADMAREDATRYLLQIGVPVGVYDDTGNSALSLIIEKMPSVAQEALDQFQLIDHAFRKRYIYLNYLEEDPIKWREINNTTDEYGVRIEQDESTLLLQKKEKRLRCPTTALGTAVQAREFDVIMHPAMQQLIKVKWQLYGKVGAIIAASIHFCYIMIWTWLAIFLPSHGAYYSSGGLWWRIPLEILGCLMTLYFILKQIWEAKISHRDKTAFRQWRSRQINRDLEYCHPRWPQEKTFLESELNSIRTSSDGYFSDPWNVMDCMTYVSVLVVIVTRIVSVTSSSTAATKLHPRAYAFALIFMWLHFMKSCRPFTTLGPFITMLGHVIIDTLKFCFLFFEFFIPYLVSFWILFGGEKNADKMREEGTVADDWENFNDLTFSVLQITFNADFNLDAIRAVNNTTALVMVGTYYAVSTVLCLNLYIALLSETFNRVYQNAKENAAMLQAATVLQLENALTKARKSKVNSFVQLECAPMTLTLGVDVKQQSSDDLWRRAGRAMIARFETFGDFLKRGEHGDDDDGGMGTSNAATHSMPKSGSELYNQLMHRDKELFQIKFEVYELKCSLLQILGEKQMPPPPVYTPITQSSSRPQSSNSRNMDASKKHTSKNSFGRRSEDNLLHRNNRQNNHGMENNRPFRRMRDENHMGYHTDGTDDLDPIYESRYEAYRRPNALGRSWDDIRESDSDTMSLLSRP